MKIKFFTPRLVIKSCIAFTCLAGTLNLTLPISLTDTVRAEARVSTMADLSLRSESQIKSEASLFQTALTEISRISTMKLTSTKELAAANAIIEKNVSNLRYERSKLIALGLADGSFTGAMKAKGSTKAGAESFGTEVAKDPTSILKVSGGQVLADRMRASLSEDIAKVRLVAQLVKKASEDLKAKQAHHASPTTRDWRTVIAQPPATLYSVDVTVLVVVVAVIAFPPLGLVLVDLASTALAAVTVVGLAAAAVALIGNLIKNAGTDEGRDAVATCQNDVDRQYRRCVNAAADMGLLADVAKALCYGDWLLGSTECWIT